MYYLYCAFSIKYSKAHYLKAICLTSQNDWPPYTLSWSLSLKLWMSCCLYASCLLFISRPCLIFFVSGGMDPVHYRGSMDQVQNAGSMEPMFCPHTSLPYHSLPLSQRSSGSMPVSCKVPTIKLTWTVFLKKSLFQGHPTRI